MRALPDVSGHGSRQPSRAFTWRCALQAVAGLGPLWPRCAS